VGGGDGGFKTIAADEYTYSNFMANTSQIIDGVDVFWPKDASSSGLINGEQVKYSTRAASYPPANQQGRGGHVGAIIPKQPPGWLVMSQVTPSNSPCSTGEGCENIGDILNPNQGAATSEEQNKQLNGDVLYRFAKHFYMSELLQQRYGELSGKYGLILPPEALLK
jgi:hypothetical protein